VAVKTAAADKKNEDDNPPGRVLVGDRSPVTQSGDAALPPDGSIAKAGRRGGWWWLTAGNDVDEIVG